jgi:hypothetical protein
VAGAVVTGAVGAWLCCAIAPVGTSIRAADATASAAKNRPVKVLIVLLLGFGNNYEVDSLLSKSASNFSFW